ncbi:MAG TPA: ATP synthase F1 subunit gamma [Fibrobacteria bacterium]|jgi:F-type H+-transporting ATPase subunit gamma|nr:ATP synthase F1 subunit gamma [Fibrobacteria bacterium]
MAGIKELRLRIKALKNTSKITAAMKMVSAAKLKRAQDAYTRAKPYAQGMEEAVSRVLGALESPEHPLLQVRDVKRVRYVVVSSDRGLAGAFNNGLLRTFARRPADSVPTEALGVGRRAREFVARSERLDVVSFEATNVPTHANAEAIAQSLTRDFLDGKVDKVVLVYNRFNSVISQTPVFVPLLPLAPSASTASAAPAGQYRDVYLFEPDEKTLLESLLPRLVTVQVFRALLENAVGEHSARMTAMDNATKNTKDLIGSMSLTMNRARQAAITRELIEIVSGAEALKG